ncbi:MAG TPA: hypothetical protein VLD63_04895 [Anaerolineales bacterium]|nr:hypothetical protein [Anaerolineales bacterium]
MSMQALNRLVARSIIDPTVLQSFGAGRIGDVLADLKFSPEMRRSLSSLQAESWCEFAVQAYRIVQAAEEPVVRIQLPSPMEGLLNEGRADQEQVA